MKKQNISSVAISTINKIAPYSAESRSDTARRVWAYIKSGFSSLQIQKIFALAARLELLVAEYDFSLDEVYADAEAALAGDSSRFALLIARKVDGTKMVRVVMSPDQINYQSKGTGRPMKPGQRLLVDLAKYTVCACADDTSRCMISVYEDRVISIAA